MQNENVIYAIQTNIFILLIHVFHLFPQNLIIDKVCHDLGFNKTICANIDKYVKEDDQVQTKVSELNMYMNILGSVPCMLVRI